MPSLPACWARWCFDVPIWLQILVSIIAVVGPWIAGYFGTVRGVEVSMAVHGEQIKALQDEVRRLREAKHEHANYLTRHEAELEILRSNAGLEAR